MAGGKVVNIGELLLHDASNIESDTSWLSDDDWKALIPTAGSVEQVKRSIEAGDSVLLSNTPQRPLFTFVTGERVVNSLVAHTFPSNAILAINRRFDTAGSSITFQNDLSDASLSPSPALDYIPDTSTVKEDIIPLAYQYNVEVACTPQCLTALSYGYFMLAKTSKESKLALSHMTPLGGHTLLTIQGRYDEPKKLVHMLATGKNNQLSIKPVSMLPLGNQYASESFIPVQLTVQVGDKLGYPTCGYFYHFKQSKLVHEYAICEGANGSFNITNSTAKDLSDDIYIPALKDYIFLPWKIKGKVVTPQHLYYSKQKLTAKVFNSIDLAWLNSHAVTVDINAILVANQQSILPRGEDEEHVSQDNDASTKAKNHTVLSNNDGSGRESWRDIAEQYKLSANDLLSLNPKYQQDPMTLKVGDILQVTQLKPNYRLILCHHRLHKR